MIRDPNEIAPALVDDLKRELGDVLQSVVMYGEAVSHEFIPGKSNIPILLILDTLSSATVTKVTDVVTPWLKKGMITPSLMTPEMLSDMISIFPVELLGIQRSYRVLHGPDPIDSITLCKESLRDQCRRELAGMVQHVSNGFIRNRVNHQDAKKALKTMVKSTLPVFSALLVLYDKKIPHATTEIIAAVEDLFGFGSSVLSELYLNRQKRTVAETYIAFYDIITTIYDECNQLTIADIHDAGGDGKQVHRGL